MRLSQVLQTDNLAPIYVPWLLVSCLRVEIIQQVPTHKALNGLSKRHDDTLNVAGRRLSMNVENECEMMIGGHGWLDF